MDWLEDEPDAAGEGAIESLLRLIEQEKAQMVAVATGGPRIEGENGSYQKRRSAISRGLRRLGVADPNPHGDLWQWYGHWSSELGGYASRRQYISELFESTLNQLRDLLDGHGIDDPHEGDAPIDWPHLEARLDELKSRLAAAESVDDRQDVGRRAREIIIDAVNLTFDESMVTEGEVPKAADAVARFDWIVRARVAGSSNEKLRAVCKSTWQLAQRVTHNAEATELEAWLAAQVTVVLVRTLQRSAATTDRGSLRRLFVLRHEWLLETEDHPVEAGCGCVVHAGRDVLVGVGRERVRVVAEPLSDDLEVLACDEQERGTRVP